MVMLECHGNAYLTQIMLCLELDAVTGLPGRQVRPSSFPYRSAVALVGMEGDTR